MKSLIASHHQQAELAARQLGIGPREWRLVRTVRDLDGVDIRDCVEVLPIVDFDRARGEINVRLAYLQKRESVSILRITT